MNLNDYETKYFALYHVFAETVRFILTKALLAAESLPRPQSIQYRAKELESLRRRLAEVGKLSTPSLELRRAKAVEQLLALRKRTPRVTDKTIRTARRRGRP